MAANEGDLRRIGSIVLLENNPLSTAVEASLLAKNIKVINLTDLKLSDQPVLVLYLSQRPQQLDPIARQALFDQIYANASTVPIWFLRAVPINKHEIVLGPVVLFKVPNCLDCVDIYAASLRANRSGNIGPLLNEVIAEQMSRLVVQQVVHLIEGTIPTVGYPNQIVVFDTLQLKSRRGNCSTLSWCRTCAPAEVYSWEIYSSAWSRQTGLTGGNV